MYDCEDSMNDTSVIMLSHTKHLLLERILQKICTIKYEQRSIDCNSEKLETSKMYIHRGITN